MLNKAKTDQLELALEELRGIYNRVKETSDVLDGKASALIENSSIVLTVFTGFQAVMRGSTDVDTQLGPSLFLPYALFFMMLAVLLFSLRPQVYKLPFIPDLNGVSRAILSKRSYKQAVLQLVVNYQARIEHNQGVNNKKVQFLNFAYCIFIVIMALLIAFSVDLIQ
ncbi:MAG: hypothetical protein KIT29_01845 [Anaerolineales bacterium]|nr:hypothetical protein [Anaerolineales bacterium]